MIQRNMRKKYVVHLLSILNYWKKIIIWFIVKMVWLNLEMMSEAVSEGILNISLQYLCKSHIYDKNSNFLLKPRWPAFWGILIRNCWHKSKLQKVITDLNLLLIPEFQYEVIMNIKTWAIYLRRKNINCHCAVVTQAFGKTIKALHSSRSREFHTFSNTRGESL